MKLTFDIKLQAAKLKIATSLAPYYSKGLYSMTPVHSDKVAVAAVDQTWRLYLNTEALKKWSVDSTAMLLVHELRHLLSKHSARAKALGINASTAGVWNTACDCEINSQLKAEDYPAPPGGWTQDTCVLPEFFDLPDGLTAEEYYKQLQAMDPEPEPEPEPDPEGEPGDSEDEDTTSGSGEGDHPGDEEDSPSGTSTGTSKPKDPEDTLGEPQKNPGESAPDAPPKDGSTADDKTKDGKQGTTEGRGSGVDGIPKEYEEQGEGEVPKGIDSDREMRLISEIATEIQSAPPGTIHGNVEDWAAQLLQPRVNWRKELAAQIRRAIQSKRGKSDYTYNRPSRRQSGRDYVVPAMIDYDPEIVVAVDTSYSMGLSAPSGGRILDAAVSEIDGILRGAGKLRVPVFAVDTEAAKVQMVTSAKNMVTSGGGGTDMGAGIKAAEAMKPRPDIVIVVTDGITPWPKSRPKGGMSVLIARLAMNEWDLKNYPAPSWARVIDIDREEL